MTDRAQPTIHSSAPCAHPSESTACRSFNDHLALEGLSCPQGGHAGGGTLDLPRAALLRLPLTVGVALADLEA